MSHVIAVVMLLVTTQPAPDLSLCEWMSGADVQTVDAHFANAKASAARGDYVRAIEGFVARSDQLEREAQKACFDPEESTFDRVTTFLDKRVRDERPLLYARRDQWALPAETTSWAAYLACKAGRIPTGIVLLRTTWRDWAAESVRDDMAFLALASSNPSQAADAIVESPKTVLAMVAKGLFHCRLGESKAGMSWLAQAHAKAEGGPAAEKITALMDGCAQ